MINERNKMNKDNPLCKYIMENRPTTKEIVEKSGLTYITITRIAKRDKDHIKKYLPYGTIEQIKETLGVDLINDWE